MANNDEPATKGDLAAVRSEIGSVRDELKGEIAALRRDVELSKLDVKRHFDVVIEDLRHDLIGARSDEVEVLKDGRNDHERRIRRLEKDAGLIAA